MPLCGDLRNQGLSEQTSAITTTPTWATVGKIGSKSLYTKTRQTTMYFPNLVGISTYSVAYWLYIPTATAPTAWSDMFGIAFNCAGTTMWERDERRAATTTGRHNYHLAKSTSEGSNTNSYYGTREDDSANDNWVHYVLTKDDSSAKLYADGTLVVTIPATNFESTKRTMTGNVYFGDSGCEAYLNDFRIYDHCLSQMEVKELSKGLVVHYPLNRHGWGQENLLRGTYDWSHWVNSGHATFNGEVATLTGTTADWSASIHSAHLNKSLLDGTTTYTWSFEYNSTATWACNPVIGGTATDVDTATASRTKYVYWQNVVSLPSTDGKWKKYVLTPRTIAESQMTSGSGDVNSWFLQIYNRTNDAVVQIRHIKLEKGSVATPWCPNSSDALATTMGLNGTTEYDCSGFCNNGTRTGTFSWTSDTPKYAVNTNFAAVGTIINNTSPIHLSNEFTIAWWGKINSWKKNWEGMFLLQNNATLNAGTNTYDIMSTLHASRANSMSFTICQNSSSYIFDRYKWTYTIGVWAHYTCTYKAGVITMYQNGISIYTETITDNSSNDYYYRLGYRANSCDCQLSDFRIYATALSADDVKSLYQNSAYIDSSGNVYGAVHSEV